MGCCTGARTVKDVCEVMWSVMVQEHMPFPQQHHWKRIAADFPRLWNCPNCLGAIHGKHVVIQASSSTGSMYYSSKGSFSMVLLAVVDARYLFRMVDVGAYGKSSDGGTLCASDFGRALHQGTLDLPEDELSAGAEDLQPVPHVFVGDEAFPLKKHLLRPYPGNQLHRDKCVFSHRLSRGRRMVECTFGILAAQWRQVASTTASATFGETSTECLASHQRPPASSTVSCTGRRLMMKRKEGVPPCRGDAARHAARPASRQQQRL